MAAKLRFRADAEDPRNPRDGVELRAFSDDNGNEWIEAYDEGGLLLYTVIVAEEGDIVNDTPERVEPKDALRWTADYLKRPSFDLRAPRSSLPDWLMPA